jgi:hypothetical protein
MRFATEKDTEFILKKFTKKFGAVEIGFFGLYGIPA